MQMVAFLVNLTGSTMLLLFAVWLVRTGVEHAQVSSFRRLFSGRQGRVGAVVTGMTLAIVMQSSAAVAVLTAGNFAGVAGFNASLAIILGGDLGSALVVQFLSFPVDWIIAPLLAVGGWLTTRSEGRRHHVGRAVMGIALVLVALSFLRDAVQPVRDSGLMPVISSYLDNDAITAFLVGAVLALAIHSSVAAILIIVTFVDQGAVAIPGGLFLVLGANFGSGLIPVWMARAMSPEARHLLLANFACRASLSLLAAALLMLYGDRLAFLEYLSAPHLVITHVLFNLLLIVVWLPIPQAARWATSWAYRDAGELDSLPPTGRKNLDERIADQPKVALTGLKQELLHMLGLVEAMFALMAEDFLNRETGHVKSATNMDDDVNASLKRIRHFVTKIPDRSFSKSETKSARELFEYAVRLEAAGDVVRHRMTRLVRELAGSTASLSDEGIREIRRMRDHILVNVNLAASVLISDDPENARILSLEKTAIKAAETKSRIKHFKRILAGRDNSIRTSDLHLEMLRALREFNSHISAVAYPTLYRTGQLLKTRLVQP